MLVWHSGNLHIGFFISTQGSIKISAGEEEGAVQKHVLFADTNIFVNVRPLSLRAKMPLYP